MAEPPAMDESPPEHRRIYSQLLQQQRRAMEQLTTLRDELAAPVMSQFVETLRAESADGVPEGVTQVLAKVEDAIRSIEFCQSELRRELTSPRERADGSASETLPPALVRFLDERKGSDDFEYDLRKDAVRGWIIRWKEYTQAGTVRGSGQFYERPYAWLEE